MPGPKEGSRIDSNDNFDFEHRSWSNSGNDGDKGEHTTSSWKSSNGGWNKTDEHYTNHNRAKGSPGRHKKR